MRDLKLNSLARYSKTSPLLVLEEHGHCEVPAGCGGVVLRWRNPSHGVPLAIQAYTSGARELLIDGQPPLSALSLLPWGSHVCTLKISGFDPQYAVLSFAALYEEKATHFSRKGLITPIRIVSALDGSWKYTVTEPTSVAWQTAEFDDTGWDTMVESEINPAVMTKNSPDSYSIKSISEKGGISLGIPVPGEIVWIRKVFLLEQTS